MESNPTEIESSSSSRPHRLAVVVGLVLAIVALVGLAVLVVPMLQLPTKTPASKDVPGEVNRVATLPTIDWTDADPAVEKAVNAEVAVVESHQDDPAAWGKLGMLLYAHEFNLEAADCFLTATQLSNADAMWPYMAGICVRDTEPRLAIERFEKALQIGGPHATLIRLMLAESMIEEGQLDDALPHLNRVSVDDEKYPRAALALGRIALISENLGKAERHFTRASEDPVAAHDAHLLLSQVSLRLGKTDLAESHRLASEAIPKRLWHDPYVSMAMELRTGLKALLLKSNELFKQNRVLDSIAILRDTTRQYPDAEWGWILLGRSLIRQGMHADARSALEKALELSPDSVEAMFRLSVAYAKDKRIKESVIWLRKALKNKPDFGMAHYNLGVALTELRAFEEALGSFEEAVRFMPNHFNALALLGNAHAMAGDNEKALMYLNRANQIKPNDSYVTPRIEAVKRRQAKSINGDSPSTPDP